MAVAVRRRRNHVCLAREAACRISCRQLGITSVVGFMIELEPAELPKAGKSSLRIFTDSRRCCMLLCSAVGVSSQRRTTRSMILLSGRWHCVFRVVRAGISADNEEWVLTVTAINGGNADRLNGLRFGRQASELSAENIAVILSVRTHWRRSLPVSPSAAKFHHRSSEARGVHLGGRRQGLPRG